MGLKILILLKFVTRFRTFFNELLTRNSEVSLL